MADVADRATGAPIRDADVVLMDLHRVAHTNWMGEARLTDVEPGIHRVRVRKLGFVAADLELPFSGDSVGQVFLLAEAPTSLDTIRVTASNVPVYLQPFERRLKMGIGRFLTEDQLSAEREPALPIVLATHFAGLHVSVSAGHYGIGSTRPNNAGGIGCEIAIYLDGVHVTNQSDLWDITATWDLAGVEYYTAAEAPPPYYPYKGECGVLLLWSRWN